MNNALAALATALLLVGVGAAPVSASRPGVTPSSKCVSGYEFEQLRAGTPRAEAEAFLDGPGRGDQHTLRHYRSCAGTWRQAQVSVKYLDGRVFSVFDTRISGGGHFIVPAK